MAWWSVTRARRTSRRTGGWSASRRGASRRLQTWVERDPKSCRGEDVGVGMGDPGDEHESRGGSGVKDVIRRAGWGFFDQGLSSATNFALTALVAGSVSVNQFGAFTLVYAVYGLFLGVCEGFASTPLTVRFSAETGSRLHAAERDSVGSALAIGLVGGIGCLSVSPFAGHDLGTSLAAMGVMLPGLLLQDAWRYAFLARAKPALAAFNDGVWAVLQFTGIGVL